MAQPLIVHSAGTKHHQASWEVQRQEAAGPSPGASQLSAQRPLTSVLWQMLPSPARQEAVRTGAKSTSFPSVSWAPHGPVILNKELFSQLASWLVKLGGKKSETGSVERRNRAEARSGQSSSTEDESNITEQERAPARECIYGLGPGLRLSLSANMLAGCGGRGVGRRSPQEMEGKPQPMPSPGGGDVPRVQDSEEPRRRQDTGPATGATGKKRTIQRKARRVRRGNELWPRVRSLSFQEAEVSVIRKENEPPI